MKAKMAMVLAAVSAASCSTVTYQAPAEGPKATMTVHWDNASINTPVRLHDRTCTKDGIRKVGNLNNRAIGMPSAGDTLTFDVPAGQPLGISVGAARREIWTKYEGHFKSGEVFRACEQVIDFTPAAGRHYNLEVNLPPKTLDKCTESLNEVDDNGASKPDPTAKVREQCTVPYDS